MFIFIENWPCFCLDVQKLFNKNCFNRFVDTNILLLCQKKCLDGPRSVYFDLLCQKKKCLDGPRSVYFDLLCQKKMFGWSKKCLFWFFPDFLIILIPSCSFQSPRDDLGFVVNWCYRPLSALHRSARKLNRLVCVPRKVWSPGTSLARINLLPWIGKPYLKTNINNKLHDIDYIIYKKLW